jgi:hypothetical protein
MKFEGKKLSVSKVFLLSRDLQTGTKNSSDIWCTWILAKLASLLDCFQEQKEN